jgi:tetratricopeptide (TPR) repeat protein
VTPSESTRVESRWSRVAVDDVDRLPGGRIPIRAHFGVEAFGVNAWTAESAGDTVIGEHTEEREGHEELYVVLRGRATFTIAGDVIDAPAGAIVFVRDPGTSRKAVADAAGTTVLAVGGKPGAPFTVSAWERAAPYGNRGMAHYRAGGYAEAAAAFEEGIDAVPEFAGVHYNAACMRSLTGEADRALAHLRRAIELDPSLADLAKGDADFDPIRERVAELTG